MFWGDSHLSRDIALLGAPSDGQRRKRAARLYVPSSHLPLLKVGVVSLPPGVSRSPALLSSLLFVLPSDSTADVVCALSISVVLVPFVAK
jgi:hypothetical protein